MADISLLIGRNTTGFTADTRFVAMAGGPVPTLPEAMAALERQPPTSAAAPASQPAPAAPAAPQADPAEAIRAEAYAAGFAAARAEAEAQAAAEDAARTRLAAAFARLDAAQAEQLRQRLFDTVAALCESCLAPLALDEKALKARIERAVAMFARADDERVIRLHPEDLAIAERLLPADWVLSPDPALERGALRVEARNGGMAAGGVEDGPREWRRAIAEALELGAEEAGA